MTVKQEVFELLKKRDKLHAKIKRCPNGSNNSKEACKGLREVNYQQCMNDIEGKTKKRRLNKKTTKDYAQELYDLGIKLKILDSMRKETIGEMTKLFKESTATNHPY